MIAEGKLAKIVGAGNVFRQTGILEQYAKDLSFVPALHPDCVAKPGNADEIRQIVNLARETQTPLVPVSSGPPHFRGDTVPGTGGAVVVDLSGMKKIFRVDRLNRVCMFEPGVTFGELIPAVTKEGLRLNMPLMPRSTKSVTASLLEREPVTLPTYHWDIMDPMDCLEIIFGTGDMFRTGAAAGPGTIEDQWKAGGAQVEAAGPSSASWYRLIGGAQGTMGIVTWSSARCEILPQKEEPYCVGSANLDALMEMAHWLIRLRIPNECFILNKTSLAGMMARTWPVGYEKMKESLPPWVLFFNLAGYNYFPEERIKAHDIDVREIAQKTQLVPARSAGNISAFDLLKASQTPSPEPYWKLRPKGACQDIFFITDFQSAGATINTMSKAADETGYSTRDLGIYIQPLVQGCNYHVEFNLFYNPVNRKETDSVKKLAADVISPLIARGAFFSRPYGETTRLIMNRDAATVNALKRVKGIVDPQNVMNPGKLCF
jgi:FAD/FMN-containing dehydrogenase